MVSQLRQRLDCQTESAEASTTDSFPYPEPLGKTETRLLRIDEVTEQISVVYASFSSHRALPPKRVDHHKNDLIERSSGWRTQTRVFISGQSWQERFVREKSCREGDYRNWHEYISQAE